MKAYSITLIFVFAAGLAGAWVWGLDHRLDYLSRDYALFVGKKQLIEGYSRPGLAIFGDSAVMDGIQPEKLGSAVVNLAMNGSTPIESYFLIQRLLKGPVHPRAVLLSYNAYHFVHPDFYWENSVKFGLVGGKDADEVLGIVLKRNDGELITGSGIWDLELRLHSYLLSRGFPSYYVSSLIAEPYGARRKENEEVLKIISQTRGQYFLPQANGSKDLNMDTKLKEFKVSPVVDYYFEKTLEVLQKEKIPAYFYAMPTNESSVPYLDEGVFKSYRDYLESFTRKDPQFRILSKLTTVYPWTLFSDYAHLNKKGAQRFNRELAETLNRSAVPGRPYGPPAR